MSKNTGTLEDHCDIYKRRDQYLKAKAMTNPPPQQPNQETDEQRRLREASESAEAERVREEQANLLAAATATNFRIEAVSAHLKLPELWKEQPALWFIRCEVLFTTHRITADQTKFNHVIAALDQDTFILLAEAIQAPPASGKYEYLKSTIISRFADSADRSLQRLLNEMALGADRPSQLLAKMRNLAQGRLSDEVLRIRWAALLPTNIQPLLKILPSTDLNELATLADRLMEGQQQICAATTIETPPLVCAASSSQRPSMQQQIDDLRTIITALTTQLANQARFNRERSRSRSRSRQRGSSQQRGPSQQRQQQNNWCYFHNKWGSSARNCQQPCTFNTQGSLNP